MQVFFVNIHIAQAVDGYQTTNHSDYDHHDERQTIGRKGRNGGGAVRQNKFEVKQPYQLQCGHAHDRAAAELPAQAQNVDQQQKV